MISLDISVFLGKQDERYSYCYLFSLMGASRGRETAAYLQVKDLDGTEEIFLFSSRDYISIDSAFMGGLLQPLIRKVGIEKVINLVKTDDIKINIALSELQIKRKTAFEKRELKKAKEENPSKWSTLIQLLIPEIGTLLLLENDWEFTLYNELRNEGLCKICDSQYRHRWQDNKAKVTLLAGTTLKVDRIYIRKGFGEYSSLTFYIQKGKESVLVYNRERYDFANKNARFWAKLSDVNKILATVDIDTLADN